MHLSGRKSPIVIIAPPELKVILATLYGDLDTCFSYAVTFIETQTEQTAEVFTIGDILKVESIPLKHRVHCTGYKFTLTDESQSYSYAYISDSVFLPEIVDTVKNVGLLYHEATFLHDRLSKAKETGHSTAHQAATIAKMAEVKSLIVGHFSARYQNLSPILQEALTVFPSALLALEGETFDVLPS
jgi:ribonuclease Z